MSLDKNWPKLADASVLGKRHPRLDGPDKVAGRAKYTYDVKLPRMLWAKFVLSPHGRCKVKSVDLSAAKELRGVVAAKPLAKEGDELRWAGMEVAVVAAESEEAAREAARRVVVDYEVLEHNVDDKDPEIGEPWAKVGGERENGDVDAAFATPGAVAVKGTYGAPIITHCCLEPHGSVVEFEGEDKLKAWTSTQGISAKGEEFADVVGIKAADVHAVCQHLGGGFGSKFALDVWDREITLLAQETKRPVKALLERDHELINGGARPSHYAAAEAVVTKEGELLGVKCKAWGSGGPQGGDRVLFPYVFTGVPNSASQYVSIRTNTGPRRAWRAPSHPQNCLVTMALLEDAAAAIGMDPLAFFKQNLRFTERPEVYAEELDIAAKMMGWADKWKPRGSQTSTIRRGLGLSIHTWGGGGGDSSCQTTINGDGSVVVACGTQDLGVGTRTVLAVVTAETFGLPVEAVRVQIGDNKLPPSGSSGGSTTVGGISSSSRHAAIDALGQLVEKLATEWSVPADQIVAKGGKIGVAADPTRSLSWAEACGRIGRTPIVGTGRQDQELMDSGVGGVQMAEVSVDMETGVVAMERMVAVQDCGTIVDLMTAESQVYGACIMGITSALYEERVMDPVTGRTLNPDMEYYRLAGIGDIGEIEVHMMQTEAHHGRGVIGLGEPPAISPMAAICNAVANAIGVRAGELPLTPARVLAALKGGAR